MTKPGGWREHLMLLGTFLRHPRTVGAVAPSSQELAREMVRGLALSGSTRIVELGPGTGVFTSEILAHLGPTDRYLAIEIDPGFADAVRARWPGIECVCDSAEHLSAITAQYAMQPIDHIVSGLPFASLPQATSRTIMDAIAACLRPGGTFTTFQYRHAWRLPPAVAFRAEMTERLGPMTVVGTVFRNLPPAHVLRWSFPQAGTG